MRNWIAAAAASVCLIAAGCGGGGGDSTSTAAGSAAPEVTSPNVNSGGESTTTTRPRPHANSSNGPAAQGSLPPGAQPVQQALAPFRQCLEEQGVSLPFLRGAAGGAQRPGQGNSLNSQQYRAQVEKAFTCIPKLPPRIRQTAERLKRRFAQRNP